MRMEGLRQRTKDFALRIIRVYMALDKSTQAQVLGSKLYDREPQLQQTFAKHREQGATPSL